MCCQKRQGKVKVALVILSLLLLFYSFFVQSFLVFVSVIWVYLFYYDWKYKREKSIFKQLIVYLKRYWYYIIAPAVFYIFKNIFFKPNGVYEGYNELTVKSLVVATIKTPLAAIKTFLKLCMNYFMYLSIVSIVIIVILIIIIIVKKKDWSCNFNRKSFLFHLKMTLFGFFVFVVGVFPYIVVRNGNSLYCVGVQSRDVLLASFGLSIFFYYLIQLIYMPNVLKKIALAILVSLGTVYFFSAYLNYQEDWFHQQQFASFIEDNNGFKDDHTVLCDFSNESPINGTRFYSLNGISYNVTGKMDKLYYSNIGEMSIGFYRDTRYLNHYNMNDYDFTDTTINGVLLINNSQISNYELLKIRFDEIFRPMVYKQDIKQLIDIEYCKADEALSNQIYCSYENQLLSSDVLRKELLNN